jgi:hypothetical protein
MQKVYLPIVFMFLVSCLGKESDSATAQNIVDKSIAVSGGERYRNSHISFDFRDRSYVLDQEDGQRILRRIHKTDSSTTVDIKSQGKFQRYVNDSLVVLNDTMAAKYANSVNSVHYFAYLPFGLNDRAVNKELLGTAVIKGEAYFKIRVTFDRDGGGDDHDDIYIYWFNKKTLKPDYLAYEFHTDGGGMRLREAYNERYVNGIRFVDYYNYQTTDMDTPIWKIDSLYQANKLKLLSKIELKNISVRPDNYN